jgi:acylphosphatase
MAAPSATSTIRVRAIAEGIVQGVGYRDRVRRVAHRLGVVGWVRNSPDGTVELEAQGPADRVRIFLSEISGPHGASDARSVRRLAELPVDAHDDEFRVTF